MSKFQIYKKNQGKYTRWITFVAVVGIAAAGAYQLSEKLAAYAWTSSPLLRFGLPVLLIIAVAWLILLFVNRPRTADFLIATEGEMKKVSWSSKKEIIGSTKVVIVFTFVIAALLFAVDLGFVKLFGALKILPARMGG